MTFSRWGPRGVAQSLLHCCRCQGFADCRVPAHGEDSWEAQRARLGTAWLAPNVVAYHSGVTGDDARVDRPLQARTRGGVEQDSAALRTASGSGHHGPIRLGRLVASPTVLGLFGGAVSGAFALVHLLVAAKGNLSAFILVGAGHGNRSRLPADITVYREGYDGQFYYRLALDPLRWSHSAFGITFDSSYRIARISYPVLAWLLAAGHHGAVPATLVIANVLAFGVLTGLACALAGDMGRHPAWGLLFSAYWGFLWTIARDLTELVAAAALVGALLAIRRHCPVLAAVSLSIGVLGRETLLVFVAAIAVTRLVAWVGSRTVAPEGTSAGVDHPLLLGRPGIPDVVWIVPTLVFAAWEVAVERTVGTFPVLASASSNRGAPFTGIVHAVGHYAALLPNHAALTWFGELAVLAVVALSAAFAFPRSRALLHEKLAWIGYVVLSLSLSDNIWLGDVGFRSLNEVFLFSVILLLCSPRRVRVQSVLVGLTWAAVFVQLARVV